MNTNFSSAVMQAPAQSNEEGERLVTRPWNLVFSRQLVVIIICDHSV